MKINKETNNEVKNFFLDLVFPRHCLGCNQIMTDETQSYLCSVCFSTIPIKGNFACAFCGAPVVAGKTCPFCIRKHYLDRLLVATTYEFSLVEKILKTMKYRFVKSLADDSARLMIKYFEKKILVIRPSVFAHSVPLIIPIPLHYRRLNWRGFNQSEIIAQKIAEYFGWPFDSEILKRIKNPKPQAEINDKKTRLENVSGIFACQKPETVKGKRIFLIDDISTTGSTLDDCARALKISGAKEVIGFVMARNR